MVFERDRSCFNSFLAAPETVKTVEKIGSPLTHPAKAGC
jgi:hypothetical protein